MKKFGQVPLELQSHDANMGGVFSCADLAHLMGVPYGSTLQARIASLVDRGYLKKARKGWYFTPSAKLEVLACRILPDAYISLTGALVRRGLVGTNPEGLLDLVVSRGRSGTIQTELGVVRVHLQTPGTHFGFEYQDGIPVAIPEKAVIDCCYFHLRGTRLPFRLESDLDWQALNSGEMRRILEKYKNPKFKRFVYNLMESADGH